MGIRIVPVSQGYLWGLYQLIHATDLKQCLTQSNSSHQCQLSVCVCLCMCVYRHATHREDHMITYFWVKQTFGFQISFYIALVKLFHFFVVQEIPYIKSKVIIGTLDFRELQGLNDVKWVNAPCRGGQEYFLARLPILLCLALIHMVQVFSCMSC